MATKADANKRWRSLRESMQYQQRLVEEILADEENWTKLDYPSGAEGFCDCWVDQMAGVKLALTTMPYVIYEMFHASWADNAIISALKGVGPATVAGLRKRYEQGINAEDVGVFRDKSRPEGFYVWLGPAVYDSWSAIAVSMGSSLKEIAIEAMRERFESLGG